MFKTIRGLFMNNSDLMIAVGADITAFSAALKKAEQSYKTVFNNINNNSKKMDMFADTAKSFGRQMHLMEKEAKKASAATPLYQKLI